MHTASLRAGYTTNQDVRRMGGLRPKLVYTTSMERGNPTRHLCHPPRYSSHPGLRWLLPSASSCLQSSPMHESLACQAHFEEVMVYASHAVSMPEDRLAMMTCAQRDDDGHRMKAVELRHLRKLGRLSVVRYSLTHIEPVCRARFGEAVVCVSHTTAPLEDRGIPGWRARPALMTCA